MGYYNQEKIPRYPTLWNVITESENSSNGSVIENGSPPFIVKFRGGMSKRVSLGLHEKKESVYKVPRVKWTTTRWSIVKWCCETEITLDYSKIQKEFGNQMDNVAVGPENWTAKKHSSKIACNPRKQTTSYLCKISWKLPSNLHSRL